MDAMQYEALKRAQEMQSRISVKGTNPSHNTSQRTSSANREQNKTQSSENHTKSSAPVNPIPVPTQNVASDNETKNDTHQNHSIKPQQSSPLNTLFEDKEKLLILLLILILSSEENSDPTVILALLYLII